MLWFRAPKLTQDGGQKDRRVCVPQYAVCYSTHASGLFRPGLANGGVVRKHADDGGRGRWVRAALEGGGERGRGLQAAIPGPGCTVRRRRGVQSSIAGAG